MLVTVAAYTDAIEAHIAKGRIQADGIPAYIAHEHHIWANWFISNALGGVKVQVLPQFVTDATDILETVRSSTYEQLLLEQEGPFEKEKCPKCESDRIKERRWPQKVALLMVWFTTLPVPYSEGLKRCLVCGNKWVDKYWKNYTLTTLTIIVLSAVLFYYAIIVTFYYWCKLSDMNPGCMCCI